MRPPPPASLLSLSLAFAGAACLWRDAEDFGRECQLHTDRATCSDGGERTPHFCRSISRRSNDGICVPLTCALGEMIVRSDEQALILEQIEQRSPAGLRDLDGACFDDLFIAPDAGGPSGDLRLDIKRVHGDLRIALGGDDMPALVEVELPSLEHVGGKIIISPTATETPDEPIFVAEQAPLAERVLLDSLATVGDAAPTVKIADSSFTHVHVGAGALAPPPWAESPRVLRLGVFTQLDDLEVADNHELESLHAPGVTLVDEIQVRHNRSLEELELSAIAAASGIEIIGEQEDQPERGHRLAALDLSALAEVEEHLRVEGHHYLTSVELGALELVGRELSIRRNQYLPVCSIVGQVLETMAKRGIGGPLLLDGNDEGAAIVRDVTLHARSDPPPSACVIGDVVVELAGEAPLSWSAAAPVDVFGTVRISDQPATSPTTSLALDGIARVRELRVERNLALDELALPALTHVAGSLLVGDNSAPPGAAVDVSLPALARVGRRVYIHHNAPLAAPARAFGVALGAPTVLGDQARDGEPAGLIVSDNVAGGDCGALELFAQLYAAGYRGRVCVEGNGGLDDECAIMRGRCDLEADDVCALLDDDALCADGG